MAPGSRREIHAHPFAGIRLDEHEALPVFPIALHFGAQLLQETLLELQNFLHPQAHDAGLGGGDGARHQENVVKLVRAGRQDAGAFVDLAGIDEVKHGKALYFEHFIHAFDAQAALLVEEVGNVRLLETGLLGQAQAGQMALLDAGEKGLAQIVLQHFESHGWEYSTGL